MHDNINFEAPSSVWILLLGVIACAAIVKKVYVKSSRGRNKRSASSHAFKASTDSLMTAFDSKDATIHIP
ncbi:hypothetical protein BGZ83_004322 [Gryganskiella cystojenkinii]|nr:hypothetical protein BGZ83_004322 [Gryganskiella cystojenkinii]